MLFSRKSRKNLRTTGAAAADSRQCSAIQSVIETLENRQLLSASNLDPNFGSGGEVQTHFGASPTSAEQIWTDASGRTVVTGSDGNGDALLIRYLPNGTLDPQFGSGGKSVVSLGGATINGVAIQTNDKILVSGQDGSKIYLARLNTNGSFDSTFGTGGKELLQLGNAGEVSAITETSNGKIYVATAGGSSPNYTYVVERLNSNGTEDTTFANHGVGAANIGQYRTVVAVTVESNGQIVVAGNGSGAGSSDEIVIFNASGSVSKQFSDGGGVVLTGIAVQGNGDIVASGQTRFATPDFIVERFTTSGALDSSFGSHGRVDTAFSNNTAGADDVAIDLNGKIVVVGYLNNDFEVVRYTTNGSLDSTFGTNGEVSTNFGSQTAAVAGAVTVQSSGRIVVAGQVENLESSSYSIGVVRYLGDHVQLAAGQSAITTGTSASADIRLAATFDGSETVDFSFGSGSSAVKGSIYEFVAKENVSGTLDFYYEITTNAGSLGSITSLLVSGFAGFTTYVDYRPDGVGTVDPFSASRSSDGKSITFDFANAPNGNGVVSAGETSQGLFVKTNATSYTTLGKVVLNNVATLSGFEPT